MYQVYFLSIATLILSSVALGYDRLDERLKVSSVFSDVAFKSLGFQFGLGVATLVVGVFQFLTVAPGDVPVVGDLIPALAGIILGGTLILIYYKEKSTLESSGMSTLDRIFVQNAPNLAYLGLLVALVHFFLHRVLFL